MFKKITITILCLFLGYSANVFSVTLTPAPKAIDDFGSAIVGVGTTFTGDVLGNDLNGDFADFIGSFAGTYGFIESFESTGDYTYNLYDLPELRALAPGETLTDVFTYKLSSAVSPHTSTGTFTILISGSPLVPIAEDDFFTIVPNNIITVTGNVTANDRNGNAAVIKGSPVSDFGFVILQSDGSFTYNLLENSPSVLGLNLGEVVTDSFTYDFVDLSGNRATGNINVQIIGNPVDVAGNVIVNVSDDDFDNVDVEFNNRSFQATPLNSGRNIRGQLHNSRDKDWYALPSSGEEIITLEVCPQGSSCFGKKSWVLYVFDSDLLTFDIEFRDVALEKFVDDTGNAFDESGTQIILDSLSFSNHMYLAYRSGFFDTALIGVIDPCFDTSNTVDIGVGLGPRNYLIAISSPLRGDADTGAANECGAGNVVLEQSARPVLGTDAAGNGKTYQITQEFITVFPNSDDQYVINITGTGLNPLLSDVARVKSSTFSVDSGELNIPKLRVNNDMIKATLKLNKKQSRSANDNSLEFLVTNIDALSLEEVADEYQATYNPDNQQVLIPRVTDSQSGKAYSVILQYYPASNGNEQWLEVINIEEIK